MLMRTYREMENECESFFEDSGPYWHAYTSGIDTPLLFVSDEDMSLTMNMIAQTAYCVSEAEIIAFTVMNNHFHFIFSASQDSVLLFWNHLYKRLRRIFPLVSKTKLQIKQIEDINSMRNNIVYVHRNGYVANSAYTPFSYPWSTCRYYFGKYPSHLAISDFKYDDLRAMFRCRTPTVARDWSIVDGYVSPTSYCSIKFGVSLFRNAHHYFSLVSKNVEAYSGIAVEIDDGEFLTDSELFMQLTAQLKAQYGVKRIKELSHAQRLDVARMLHYDYRSSNGQIRRLLALDQFEVDSLFPIVQQK